MKKHLILAATCLAILTAIAATAAVTPAPIAVENPATPVLQETAAETVATAPLSGILEPEEIFLGGLGCREGRSCSSDFQCSLGMGLGWCEDVVPQEPNGVCVCVN